MDRRNFVKMLAAMGFASSLPLATGPVRAAGQGGTDRFLVSVSADGGWDVTSLFDPKGTANGINHAELDDSLVNKQGMRWSAVPGEKYAEVADIYQKFFTTYGSRLTLIKGVHTMTSSHVLGMRAAWSGFFGTHPMLGALYGAVHGANLPLSYVTFGGAYGGNDYTAGLKVSKARLNRNGSLLDQIANGRIGQRPSVYEDMMALHTTRLNRQIEQEKLPQRARKMSELLDQRLAENHFALLKDNIDLISSDESFSPDWFPDKEKGLKAQARIAAATLATGLSSSVSLNRGGFDTHGFNDNQYYGLGDLLEGLNYLIQALDYFGIADRTTIMVSSDVGRTPHHNATGGKDHHMCSGQMIIHPKNSSLGGNMFGESTDSFQTQPIDFNTGKADSNGTELNVRHTLYAMRELLNLNGSEQAEQFDLGVKLMPNLFG